MPDQVKMLITEKNGVDIEDEELAFLPENMPFSDPSYTADNTKDAIIETGSVGGQSRYVVPCGYESQVQNGRWLEFHRGTGSDENPYVATESIQIISISMSIPEVLASVTLAIFKNDTQVETLVLTNNNIASKVFSTPLSLIAGDKVSIQKISGNNSSAIVAYPHFKVPF